ncbi:hypothetical protein BGZ98_008174 [Dissophora globulifera]|nr:hypothetical protein BGZ98_008174 [Dissophora globulifera]
MPLNMAILKTTAVLALLVTRAAAAIGGPVLDSAHLAKDSDSNSTLNSTAPSANTLQGVHLLLDNDLDSETPKFPVILLSKPRSYQQAQVTCESLGENLVNSTYGNLTQTLNTTTVAQAELMGTQRLWISNSTNPTNSTNSTAPTNSTIPANCTAFDRVTGQTVQILCSVNLPSLCTNSLNRTTLSQNDKSQQIKVVTRTFGTWQGYRDQDQFRFLGIPYAAPPVGNLRFQAPQPVNASLFNGTTPGNGTTGNGPTGNSTAVNGTAQVNDATEFGYVCPQLWPNNATLNQSQTIEVLGAEESEDCLYLNVFTPSLKANGTKGLPVMVYVHGGGFSSISGSSPPFEPGNLVSRGGVVVVTMNYRLSMFGLFENTPNISRSQAPGNLAIRDQVAALRWVRTNIVSFGGDPTRVTIFGESAGGTSMRALLSAPSAFSLYQNVISQSDFMGLPFSSPGYSAQFGSFFMQALNCSTTDLACAKNKTVDQIKSAETVAISQILNATDWVPPEAVFRPTVDGSFIPGDFAQLIQTKKYNTNASILWGTTQDETAGFISTFAPNPIPIQDANQTLSTLLRDNGTQALLKSPYYQFNQSDTDTVRNQLSNATTDYYYGCPLQVMSRGAATQNSTVYAYQMNYGRSVNASFGLNVTSFCQGRVCHGDDIVPSFGSGDLYPGIQQTGDNARFSRQVIDRFTTFAKTGNPNPPANSTTLGAAAMNEDVTGVQWPLYNASSNPLLYFEVANSTVANNSDTAKCNWIAENVNFDYQVHSPNGTFVPIFPAINGTQQNGTQPNSTQPTTSV